MNRMKLGTMLIGAAVGGMVVNVSWYTATKAFLEKKMVKERAEIWQHFGEVTSIRLLANQMAAVAQRSKTMSIKDKDEILRIQGLIWENLSPEEKLEVAEMIKDKAEEWATPEAEVA